VPNPEHLAKLREGVEAWNHWRELNRKVCPDLSGADIIGAVLRQADLSKADLSKADLRGTDLFESNLSEAGLSGANLNKADLSKADLSRADLRGTLLKEAILEDADLREADLTGADLFEADLIGAELIEANLKEAVLNSAKLIEADLRGAILTEANLIKADLYGADLRGANLFGAHLGSAQLIGAHLIEANLSKADLSGANLFGAHLIGADLIKADLSRAMLIQANLSRAKLNMADLSLATLVETNLERADLTSCSVHGISVWDVKLEGAIQSNLVITHRGQSVIQIDNLEVAQFIYLLLNNERIRHVIDTITSKVVLILGRFTPERRAVLDALRDALRKHDYLPILFDFEKPSSQTTVETISTLAHMAKFVIADLTDAKSILQELQAIVPLSPSAVVQPLLLASQEEPGMFDFVRRFPWVLETHRYATKQTLLAELDRMVIAPAEAKAKELARK